MNIELPFKKADTLIDSQLHRIPGITYERQRIDDPEKIVYEIRLDSHPNYPWEIIVIELDTNITEVAFPIHIPPFDVIHNPHGGIIEILEGEKSPNYTDPMEKAVYRICNSVWVSLKLGDVSPGKVRRKETSAQPEIPTVPENIQADEIDALWLGKAGKDRYQNYSDDKMHEILRVIPEAWKNYQNRGISDPPRWGPAWVAHLTYDKNKGIISNHLRVLYSLGVRHVEGVKIPYTPQKKSNKK